MIAPTQHLVALQTLAKQFAPSGAEIAVADPTGGSAVVLPQEAPAIANARPKRRREFAAGRQAARAAMRQLGARQHAIPVGPDRAPVWPSGLSGSISHDASSCVAIVGPTAQFLAFGVDVEPDAPLPEAVIEEICVSDERIWLDSQPARQRGVLARRIFCAKEAVYKAQYPLTRALFGFDAVHISLNALESGFSARFRRDIDNVPAQTVVSGRCASAGGHIFALVTLGAMRGMENANFPVCALG
ncbi:4'-phosphopantetheinyl transferase family protein [Shimia sp.]|uniref:4'-phosphopantetheinyl transferase family protein n=1 Tax=Shimia sp. TaxID=1954381 RepID=UPI003B8AF941